jgi:hypothetical protein
MLGLSLLLPPILTGCRGAPDEGDPALALELGISPTPPVVGPARLILTLTDPAGAPVDGARIAVEGTMSHAGMAPVLDSAQVEGPGRYAVPAFRFTMAGDWVLIVRATLPDGRWRELRRSTRVASGPPGEAP